MPTVAAVLLAGGTGTRLYPASRSNRPKQFLVPEDDNRSLLRRTADRAAFADHLFVVTRESYADRVRDEVPEATVLVEPEGRNTGPALTLAASEIQRRVVHQQNVPNTQTTMLCLPSDHLVGPGFQDAANTAISVASKTDALVTLGIEPDWPATGYGYIQPGTAHEDHFEVAKFREKPDTKTATTLIEQGCLWNAGVFAWTPDSFLYAARDSPLSSVVEELEQGGVDGEDIDRSAKEHAFATVDSMSVDNAVLERTDNVRVVPADFEWHDIGAWDALSRIIDGENVVIGDALTLDATGNIIASDDKHVSVVGADDLIVAAFDDRVLVVPKDDAQRVRELVSELRERELF